MAIHLTDEHQLKKEFIEKLSTFLRSPEPYRTYMGPTHPTTDDEFIKIFFDRFFGYYKQWKTAPRTDGMQGTLITDKDEIFKIVTDHVKGLPPKETKDKENLLLVKNLLDLADKRIADLDVLILKKMEILKSI